MRYRFGGLQLNSSIELDQLRPDYDSSLSAHAEIALDVETGAAPAFDEIICRWTGRYDLVLGRSGEDWLMSSKLDGVFLISEKNRSVRCFVTDPAAPGWLDVLMRRVLPRVAILFGATAIHAAAVASAGGGLLVLGGSGAGKSTLSAYLLNTGWDVLSDDISLVWHPDTPELAPASTGVCVWEDSRRALNLADALCLPMPAYDGKVRFSPGTETAIAPVPLRALIFLARSNDVTEPKLTPLSGAQGLIGAAHQRIHFNPVDEGGGETLRAFGPLSQIARAVPFYTLHYPARYDALPRTAAALRGILSA